MQQLPTDIIETISSFLTTTQKEKLNSYDVCLSRIYSRSNIYKIFAINRLKLWFVIFSRYRHMV